MALYRVRWEIDVDADNPSEAAQTALRLMCAPDSEAKHFEVREHRGKHLRNFTHVDLNLSSEVK